MKLRTLRLTILVAITILATTLAQTRTGNVFQSMTHGKSQSKPVTILQTPPAVTVTITSFAFNPQTLTVHTGDLVTWTNNDPVIHTLWFVRASDGSTMALSPPLNPGDMYTLAFPTCGVVNYYDFDRLWISGTVTTLIQGDVNGDGVVNFLDLGAIGAAFLSTPGSPNWNPAADLDRDGVINFLDLGIVGLNFLRSC